MTEERKTIGVQGEMPASSLESSQVRIFRVNAMPLVSCWVVSSSTRLGCVSRIICSACSLSPVERVLTSGSWRRQSQISARLLADGSMTSTVGLVVSGVAKAGIVG